MAPRWSDEMTVKFIALYKERELLWNQLHDLYKNKNARETALCEIEKKMNIEGFGVNEVKTKIKSLRATFIGELMKIEKSQKPGCGSEDFYVPTLTWFNLMKEVMEKKTLKRDAINIRTIPTAVGRTKTASTISNHYGDAVDKFPEILVKQEEGYNEHNNQGLNKADLTASIEPIPKRPKMTSEVSEIPSAAQERKALKSTVLHVDENEFDIFGKHVSAQLKILTVEQAVIAQSKIQAILTQFRLEDLHKNSQRT